MTRRAPAGFTLLELMVAISLLSLLGAAAAGGLRFGVTVWERGAGQSAAAVEARLAETYLRRQIAAAATVTGGEAGAMSFDGQAHRLTFHAPLANRSAAPGLWRLSLSLEETEEGALPPLRITAANAGEQVEEVLMTASGLLTFRYFGAVDNVAPSAWRPTWRAQKRLPRLVEVSLGDEDGPRRVFTIRVTAAR